jgi:hypothetical protein
VSNSVVGLAPVFMVAAMQVEWLRGNLFKITDPNTGQVRIAEAPTVVETITNYARCYRDYRTAEGAEVVQLFPDSGMARG